MEITDFRDIFNFTPIDVYSLILVGGTEFNEVQLNYVDRIENGLIERLPLLNVKSWVYESSGRPFGPRWTLGMGWLISTNNIIAIAKHDFQRIEGAAG